MLAPRERDVRAGPLQASLPLKLPLAADPTTRIMSGLFVLGWADQHQARTHDRCEDEGAAQEQHDGAVHGAGR